MKYFFYLLLLLLPASMQAQTKAVSAKDALAKTGKLSSIIDKTGYEFTKTDGGIFITKVEGKHNKEIYIIATETEGMIVLFSVVKEKAGLSISTAQFKQLLKLSLDLDRIKVGLDDEDETLMVRADFSSRTIDAEELTEGLDQIGVASDEAFGIINKK
ncbi:hypothetical protein [Phnomibacter sp. MR]|uniref:hypothetical protein n=1 Tax=Phnomibacter sp. MR TaxID=3042318 RepID=UPI003A80119A